MVTPAFLPDGGLVNIHDRTVLQAGQPLQSVREQLFISPSQLSNVQVRLDDPLSKVSTGATALLDNATDSDAVYEFVASDGAEPEATDPLATR